MLVYDPFMFVDPDVTEWLEEFDVGLEVTGVETVVEEEWFVETGGLCLKEEDEELVGAVLSPPPPLDPVILIWPNTERDNDKGMMSKIVFICFSIFMCIKYGPVYYLK